MFKRYLSLFLAFACVLGLFSFGGIRAVEAQASGGIPDILFYEENSDASAFQISTAEGLQKFSQLGQSYDFAGKTIYMICDINMSGFSYQPPVKFAGTFDGGFHAITQLTVSTSEANCGFVGMLTVGGVIRNLGIEGGVFTATEAAAVAAVYGIFVGAFIYRNMRWADLKDVCITSAKQTAVVMLIIMCANLFAYALSVTGACTAASNFLLGFVGNSKFLFLLIVNIIFLIAGMLIDGNSAYYIFLPILLPVARSLGIDPVHLCIVLVMNIAIGLITPPVGANLYTACGITGIPFSRLSRACVPFLVASLIALMLVTYIPQISLLLIS